MEQKKPNNNANGPKMNMPKFNMNWIYFVAILALGILYLTSSGVGLASTQTNIE